MNRKRRQYSYWSAEQGRGKVHVTEVVQIRRPTDQQPQEQPSPRPDSSATSGHGQASGNTTKFQKGQRCLHRVREVNKVGCAERLYHSPSIPSRAALKPSEKGEPQVSGRRDRCHIEHARLSSSGNSQYRCQNLVECKVQTHCNKTWKDEEEKKNWRSKAAS